MLTRVAQTNSIPKANLPKESDEVPVHGDALNHPVGERHPAYVDVVAAADGILDGDVLKTLVAEPVTSNKCPLFRTISHEESCRRINLLHSTHKLERESRNQWSVVGALIRKVISLNSVDSNSGGGKVS